MARGGVLGFDKKAGGLRPVTSGEVSSSLSSLPLLSGHARSTAAADTGAGCCRILPRSKRQVVNVGRVERWIPQQTSRTGPEPPLLCFSWVWLLDSFCRPRVGSREGLRPWGGGGDGGGRGEGVGEKIGASLLFYKLHARFLGTNLV